MQKQPFTIRLASWLIIAVLGIVILVYTKNFLLPMVIAGFFSLLLYPLYKRLLRWRLPNTLAVLITVLLVVILLLTALYLVSRELSSMLNDMGSLSAKVNDMFTNLQHYLAEHMQLESSTVNNWITEVKTKIVGSFGELVSGTIASTTNIMSVLVLIIVYVFCFLLYNGAFKTFFFALLADERQTQAMTLISNIQKLVQNYLLGLLTVILIIGVLNTIGLVIIGVDNALFFAFLAALLTMIPYVGITIGACITAFYTLLTKDSGWSAFAVICVMFSIQALESNLITPRIVGSRVKINPFVAILALIIGGEIWGIPGMILAVPFTAILKVLFDVYPSTQAIGYFIGSEFTDVTNDPKAHLHALGKKDEEKPGK